jgi:hypothetical protein
VANTLAAEDVEDVVGDHQHRQGAPESLAQHLQAPRPLHRPLAPRQLVHLHRADGEQGRLHAGADERSDDHQGDHQNQQDHVIHGRTTRGPAGAAWPGVGSGGALRPMGDLPAEFSCI